MSKENLSATEVAALLDRARELDPRQRRRANLHYRRTLANIRHEEALGDPLGLVALMTQDFLDLLPELILATEPKRSPKNQQARQRGNTGEP